MFKKILIANRGDVALRVLRACKEMGIQTVIVHSTADAESMPVRLADESVCIGPPAAGQSYLNIPNLVSAAAVTGCDAVHPGVGFLAENADFASIVQAHGLVFIGPEPEHIRQMGDKVQAKITAAKAGLPLVPGSPGAVDTIEEAQKLAVDIGFPLLVKAASGGGGRGMKVANSADELSEAFSSARSEAKAAFGDDTVYLERYLDNPRHIEVQVIADSHGNAVHLGERECSVQRRHQKLFEEAPSPAITQTQRKNIGQIAANATLEMGYLGVGTMEFLFQDDEFFFIEMNTRLQVEHPITEMLTRVDLVREQICVAHGDKIFTNQENIKPLGHSIECRINAESSKDFKPSAGKIEMYHPPAGNGIRLDTFIYSGYKVPHYYDNLLAKLISTGRTRNHAIKRALRSLNEIVIDGIDTNIELHKRILSSPEFKNGGVAINWLENNIEKL